MPPKRRKTSERGPTSEPKRRVTRSSTILKTTAPQDLSDNSPTAERKAPKKQSAPERKDILSSEAEAEEEEQPVQGGGSAPQNYTTLTISHDLVKKPIECHQYTPTSSSLTPSPRLIFTHGAGGTLSADAVVNFCTGFSSSLPILTFQGSMNLKARTKGFHACIDKLHSSPDTARKRKANNEAGEKKLLLGGRSMGARAAVLAASEYLVEQNDLGVDLNVHLLLVSYPLQGPKDDVRDQILLDLPKTASVLFIIGDRDAMCPLNLLHETRSKMTAKSQLVVVRGADHGMHVKPASMTQEVGEETGRLAAKWVGGGLEVDVVYIGEEREGV